MATPEGSSDMGWSFHFEVNSLEDFIAFVAWARGEMTDPKLQEMTARLHQATQALSEAQAANAKTTKGV